ncbi:MAG: hypothetical protein PSY14_06795 [bacterium]|nr:hypothetical protein [bacterium]
MSKPCLKCCIQIGARSKWEHCHPCMKIHFGIDLLRNGRVVGLDFHENREFRNQFRQEHDLDNARSITTYPAASYLDYYKKPLAGKTASRQRPCLCCGKVFRSEGGFNRVCSPCKGSAAWASGDGGGYSQGVQRGDMSGAA